MCKVEDLMTRKVLTVAAGAGVDDAAWGLTMQGLSGAPVKDERGNLIGVLSKSDLVDPGKRDANSDERTTARDVMTPVLFAARASDPIRFAARRMVETGAHRLVVVDDSGALVGIITPMDVLRGLVEAKIDPRDFDAI
jgi:CBS-domain-containing membrane protein